MRICLRCGKENGNEEAKCTICSALLKDEDIGSPPIKEVNKEE